MITKQAIRKVVCESVEDDTIPQAVLRVIEHFASKQPTKRIASRIADNLGCGVFWKADSFWCELVVMNEPNRATFNSRLPTGEWRFTLAKKPVSVPSFLDRNARYYSASEGRNDRRAKWLDNPDNATQLAELANAYVEAHAALKAALKRAPDRFQLERELGLDKLTL